MLKLYTEDKKNFLAYHKQVPAKNKAPYIVFLHGFMSDMNGHKAIYTENYCKEKGYNFIRFDNFGCGESSGKFTDQTISNWLDGLNLVLSKLTDGPVLLVGSSLGSWISILGAKLHPEKIIGVVTLAAALDFTKELIWDKLPQEAKDTLTTGGIYHVSGSNKDCTHPYPISHKLITDAKKHLLLQLDSPKKINISRPVCLIHGMLDYDVPYAITMRTAERLKSDRVTIKLIKDADHKLSRTQDLRVLRNSIDEMLEYWNE